MEEKREDEKAVGEEESGIRNQDPVYELPGFPHQIDRLSPDLPCVLFFKQRQGHEPKKRQYKNTEVPIYERPRRAMLENEVSVIKSPSSSSSFPRYSVGIIH